MRILALLSVLLVVLIIACIMAAAASMAPKTYGEIADRAAARCAARIESEENARAAGLTFSEYCRRLGTAEAAEAYIADHKE